ncbi:MAG: ATP synthase F1 subunit epsilon [Cyanobacteriota bacterium]|jgi:F-type H+-transporting ATPase subunit epsilon|nr:ATP synthase F1 subunit epsilon [Cyanobacteriota bacterium]
MTLTLRVLAPDQSVFDGVVDEVILPSSTGQLGVLTGHVSMLTALDSGVLRLREGTGWTSIALQGGFAEVQANQVTVLVNGAEMGTTIDRAAAEREFQAAEEAARAFEGQQATPEKLKAQDALAQARARLAASRGS